MDDRSPGPVRAFLSRLKILNSFRAAYSQPLFVKLVSPYRYGSAYWAYAGIVTAIFAIAVLAGSAGLAALATKQLLLEHFGSEAAATITSILSRTQFDSEHPGKGLVWTTITYEFATAAGTKIVGKIDRPANELPALPKDALPVVYWSRFPTINLPRGFGNPLGAQLMLAPLLLAIGIHFLFYVRRIWQWRRTLLDGSAASASHA